MQDVYGYEVDADGRYATAEVAAQAYAEELYSYISDASKDAQGFRHRMDISGMTFAQLEAECNYWSNQVAIAIEQEKEESAMAIEEFKALIQSTIEMGACNEETALRWLTQDETFYHSYDVEHWVYKQGILFTDYGKDLCKKLENIVSYEEVA